MSDLVFNARFTPTASNTLSADTFEVTGDVFDGSGQFSAFDVGAGDVVFLDTFNSITAPASISRYIVQSITSAGAFSVTCVMQYADSGTPVDPSEVFGNPGFVSRASTLKSFAYHAAPTIHTFPDYITQYARDYDNYVILEDELGSIASGDVKTVEGTYLNDSGSNLNALTVVRQDASGNIATVTVSSDSHVLKIVGLTKATINNSATGQVVLSGLIENVTTGFAIGSLVYLSKTGGLTVTPPDIGVGSFVAGDWIVLVGQITKNKDNPSNKDFLVKILPVGVL